MRSATSNSGNVLVRSLNNYTGSVFPLGGADSYDTARGAHADVTSITASLGLAVGVTVVTAEDSSSTYAGLAKGGVVSAAGGSVVVASRTPHYADPFIFSLTGGTLALSGNSVVSQGFGNVHAFIDDGSVVNAQRVDVSASSDNDISVELTSIGISAIGGAIALAKAVDETKVDARIGPASDATHDAGVAAASVTTTSSDGVKLRAFLDSPVTAMTRLLQISLLANAAITLAKVEARQAVRAYVGDQGALTTNGGGAVRIDSTALLAAIADGTGVGVSLGVSVGGAFSEVTYEPTVEAFTVGGGSITGPVDVIAKLNTDDGGNHVNPTWEGETVTPTFVKVRLGAAALLGSATGGVITAASNPKVKAAVGTGTAISTTGAVNVKSLVNNQATADGMSVSGALGVGIGIVVILVDVGGTVDTALNGNVTAASTVTVRSDVFARTHGLGRATSGGLGAGINVGFITATVKPVVTTGAGGNITASGDIAVVSAVRSSALADYRGIQLAAGVAGGFETVTATDETTTNAVAAGSLRSTGGRVRLHAFHNFDGTDFTADDVRAVTTVVTAAIGLALSSSDLLATAKATTEARVEPTGTLAAPASAVEVWAVSGNVARASMDNVSAGIINLSISNNPTAEASGSTHAKLLGHVRTPGSPDTAGAAHRRRAGQGERPGRRHHGQRRRRLPLDLELGLHRARHPERRPRRWAARRRSSSPRATSPPRRSASTTRTRAPAAPPAAR